MEENKVIGICPHCGSRVRVNRYGWACSNRSCRFTLWKNNAFFNRIGKIMTARMAEDLVKNRKTHLEGCISRKNGRTYNADLILSIEDDGRPRFSLEFGDRRRVKEDAGPKDRRYEEDPV